eukprot:gene15293-18107_t
MCFNINVDNTRGGSITWSSVSQKDYNIIDFNIQLAFNITYRGFAPVTLGDYVRDRNGEVYIGSDLGRLDLGEGSIKSSGAIVTSINSDFFTASLTMQHSYNKRPATYTAKFYGDSRKPDLINGDGQSKVYFLSTLVTIKETTGNVLPNSAPKANTYPLITVATGSLNTFRITALDSTIGGTLTYSLASDQVINGGQMYNQKQPSGLQVSSDGVVSFTPSQVGYYFSQIVVSNGDSWIVTDFLIKSVLPTTGDPYFTTPNDVIHCTATKTCLWTYLGKTDITDKSVIINSAFHPPGVIQTKEPGATTQAINITNTWNPTLSQVGTYIVALGMQDTSIPSINMIGQRTFTIINFNQSCDIQTNQYVEKVINQQDVLQQTLQDAVIAMLAGTLFQIA